MKLLDQTILRDHLDFADGLSTIDEMYRLSTFQRWSREKQSNERAELMWLLERNRCEAGKGIVIGGHLLFWEHPDDHPQNVGTEADWEAYTHIVYLQVDAKVIQERGTEDKTKDRGMVPTTHLRRWQAQERDDLRGICNEKGILFATVTECAGAPEKQTYNQLSDLLSSLLHDNKQTNFHKIDHALERIIELESREEIDTVLVLDADKTLAPQDTRSLFWTFMNKRKGMPADPLKMIFSRGYSYDSFLQAALLYEEIAGDYTYMCEQVAVAVALYPEMVALLARAATEPHVDAIVVTSGLREVWETVLRISGLTHVKVIGNGKLDNGYIATNTIKGYVVDQLKTGNMRVVVFGDSPLDLEMMRRADEAYVVVGRKQDRSASMEGKLVALLESGCSPRQILLLPTVEPRMTESRLPIAKLDDATLDSVLRRSFVHATQKASAKLLMTPMREASNIGHDLRKAHEEVGYYLANEYLGTVMGVESYPINLVTGKDGEGFRVRGEDRTLIVPLMRGGEPMAFGVSIALKQAAFVYSKSFDDIDEGHFEGKKTLILVDSVVNTGTSIVEYLVTLRKKLPAVKLVVVAGVVQEEAVKDVKEGTLGYHLRKDPELTLVALRSSVRRFTGKGTTDTGHRLFNTTYLP